MIKIDEMESDNQTLAADLSKYEVFRELFLEEPELVEAYNLTIENPAIRTEIRYLKSISQQLKNNPNRKPVIELLNNPNREKAGEIVNGVPFVKKTIKKNGYEIVGVFPDFSKHSAFSHTLSKEFHHFPNVQQFAIAKKALEKEYKKNPEKVKTTLRELNKGKEYAFDGKVLRGEEMLEKQIADIVDSKKNRVFGFIWHHNEKDGVMELVSEKVHNNVKHIGGQTTWAGGVHHR